jgi:pantoate--beta-alanine ligase
MLILTKIAELQAFLRNSLIAGKQVGFVPTMGALHRGHSSLIALSRKENDLTVCSIFVNPLQFNDKEDLRRYPRTPEADESVLREAGCDVLFKPDAAEIYPDHANESIDLGGLDHVLEGLSRPDHFQGVAQVVKRLFEIVNPHKAYFGTKDYQQLLVVKKLVSQLHIPVSVVGAPIVREADGLAMSSRNVLLTPEERMAAAVIPAVMKNAKETALREGITAAKELAADEINRNPSLRLDYYEICDARTLAPLSTLNTSGVISVIAVFAGKIRLIDNLPVV